MVKRIEAWSCTPNTGFSPQSLPGDTGGTAAANLGVVLGGITERRGLEQQKVGDSMITPGLAGTVEAHIMDVISRCGPVCTLRVEARGADTGESKACKFIMGCADVLRPDKASAVAAENACREQHRQAAAEVGGWINQTAADMATATVELANIEAAMAAVNAHLDELL